MDYYHEIKLGFLNRQNVDLGEFLPQSVAQDVKASLVYIKQNCELTNVCKDAHKNGFCPTVHSGRLKKAFKDTLDEGGLKSLIVGVVGWTKGHG